MVGMIVLRYLYMLALVAWLGGMLALAGLAAPSIFTVLEHQSTSAGHVLAGVVFGDILKKVQLASCVCGMVMLATLTAMRLLGPKPVHFAAQFATVVSMFAISVYSAVGGLNRIERLSVTLMMVNVAGGLSLLYWEARE
jgi:hypothetical protein